MTASAHQRDRRCDQLGVVARASSVAQVERVFESHPDVAGAAQRRIEHRPRRRPVPVMYARHRDPRAVKDRVDRRRGGDGLPRVGRLFLDEQPQTLGRQVKDEECLGVPDRPQSGFDADPAADQRGAQVGDARF